MTVLISDYTFIQGKQDCQSGQVFLHDKTVIGFIQLIFHFSHTHTIEKRDPAKQRDMVLTGK